MAAGSTVPVGGRDLPVSHPDKVLFPDDGLTKADLVGYYAAVADAAVPLVAGRPVVLQRFPSGIGAPGFVQQRAPAHFPEWVGRVEVAKEGGGTLTHVVCDDAASLAYLATQDCVTPHVWLSRRGRLDRPDRLVVDLDPATDDFEPVRRAARSLRALLGELDLPSFLTTTGSRGLHVAVPLRGEDDFDAVRAFAQDLAGVLAARDPDGLTAEVRKAKRGGRLYLDVQRNGYGQLVAAPYAVRARPGAPVATPLEWAELDDPGLTARRHTLRDVPGRLARTGDPWAAVDAAAASLGEARRRLAALAGRPA